MPARNKKTYKATIDWEDYTGNRIVLPICVRSPAVRGRNFTASMQALAERITHVHLVMCDTLDRHNLVGKDPNTDPETLALEQANTWLETGLPVLEEHIPSFDLTRWNDVKADPGYLPKYELIQRLTDHNPEARQVIENVAEFYLSEREKRLQDQGLPFNRTDELQRSVAYLQDEFAGTATYHAQFNLPEAYWGVYVGNPNIFNELNNLDPSIDLTLPRTCPILLNRLPAPVPGEQPKAP